MAVERVERACCGAHRVHAVDVPSRGDVYFGSQGVCDGSEERAGGQRDDGCVVRWVFVVCSCHPVRLADLY